MPKLTFLGHSSFLLEGKSARLIIDPFLSGNPQAKRKAGDVKVEYVLLTHGHQDHVGDALDIAKANDATIIAPFELAAYCSKKGLKSHPMHIGGSFNYPFGRVKLTIAHHGSGLDLGGDAPAYMGNPCGFLITIDGKTVYHAGDTGLFMDMKLIGDLDTIDAALLPIGDNFTMGVHDAVKAAEFLHAKLTIPMHFQTFDVIQTDPVEFREKVAQLGLRSQVLKVDESIEL